MMGKFCCYHSVLLPCGCLNHLFCIHVLAISQAECNFHLHLVTKDIGTASFLQKASGWGKDAYMPLKWFITYPSPSWCVVSIHSHSCTQNSFHHKPFHFKQESNFRSTCVFSPPGHISIKTIYFSIECNSSCLWLCVLIQYALTYYPSILTISMALFQFLINTAVWAGDGR